MKREPQSDAAPKTAEESTVAWFCVLEHAREHCHFAEAADAQRRLEALGVRVRYKRSTQARLTTARRLLDCERAAEAICLALGKGKSVEGWIGGRLRAVEIIAAALKAANEQH